MYIDTDLPCIQVMIYAGLRAPRPDMRENVYVGRCPSPRLGFFFGKKNPKDPKKPRKGKGKRARRRNVCLCDLSEARLVLQALRSASYRAEGKGYVRAAAPIHRTVCGKRLYAAYEQQIIRETVD